ncbi:MAG: 5-formyltetrahydrofolate cyclo-ligase [Christensenellales bacterium]
MKQYLRKSMLKQRNSLNLQQVESLSHKIFLNTKNTLEKIEFEKVFVYKSFKNEVDTQELIDWLLFNKKQVFLPRVEQNCMVAVKFDANSKLLKNKFGICEPTEKAEQIDDFVAIMPCLAVDKNGNRVGFGGGFYDKFLEGKNALKIVICYDNQVVENINPSKFDVPVNFIVTDKQILTTL